MKSLAPNTLLQNRYLIVHLIGKGGMGDVYLAVDQRLGSAVALKRTFFSDDEVFGTAFEREAKTLARLRHPVLPKVSDHFSENGVQFLVMEHISGDDLSKRLEAAQKPFPLNWVLFWADQLLDALAYLHAYEPPIIHRDIKPQNLKLTDENGVILLDFGLSKNTTGDTKTVTGSTGSVTGYTPHYAPMEQIRGTGTNARSDIYSLSATLYQLLTCLIPADALTRADALLNGAQDPVKPLNEINPEVPQAVAAVISRGMQLSQEKRFSSAREMQKSLRETFAQIQNLMTAQTVSFNLQNGAAEQEDSLSKLPAPEKPDVLNGAPDKVQAPPPYADNDLNSLENQNSVQKDGFDATLRIDSTPGNSQKKQSEIKTEVFPGKTSSSGSSAQTETSDSSGNHVRTETSNENHSAKPDSDEKRFAEEKSDHLGQATVPFISVENQTDNVSSQPAPTDFSAAPQIEQEADAFATYTPTRNYSQTDFSEARFDQEEENRDEQFVSRQMPERKASSGKAVAVAGGVFALLVLIAGAATAGWFVYNNYYASDAAVNPTPTLAPTVEITPTPAPTVETVAEANTNSISNSDSATNSDSVGASNSANVSNSEVVSTTTNSQTNSESDNSASRNNVGSKPPPSSATPKSTPQQQQVASKNPPKAIQAPAVKASPKPTAKKPTAPIILQ